MEIKSKYGINDFFKSRTMERIGNYGVSYIDEILVRKRGVVYKLRPLFLVDEMPGHIFISEDRIDEHYDHLPEGMNTMIYRCGQEEPVAVLKDVYEYIFTGMVIRIKGEDPSHD